MPVGLAGDAFLILLAILCLALLIVVFFRQLRYWSRAERAGIDPKGLLAANAAEALSEARVAIDKARLGIIEWGRDWPEQEDLIGNLRRLDELRADLAVRRTRLAVTVGPDNEATVAFGEAAGSVEEIGATMRAILGSEDLPVGEEEFEAGRAALDAERDRFIVAVKRFEKALAAAS